MEALCFRLQWNDMRRWECGVIRRELPHAVIIRLRERRVNGKELV